MTLLDEAHVYVWVIREREVGTNARVQLLCGNVECCVEVCAYESAYRIE